MYSVRATTDLQVTLCFLYASTSSLPPKSLASMTGGLS